MIDNHPNDKSSPRLVRRRNACNEKFFIYGLLLSVLLSFGSCGQPNEPEDGLLSYVAADGSRKAVKSEQDWEIKRHQILDSLQLVMGELPAMTGLPPLSIQYGDSLKTNEYTRYTVIFTPEAQEDVTAYLYVPMQQEPGTKYPAMVVLHGTGALGKRLVDGESPHHNRAQAKELAERGYVVIAPDYPSMGDQQEYDFDNDRYESGTMKAIFNHMRCVDLLSARDDVDPDRIGVLGHSLGGHNAMFVGAFDKRLKVMVSSCGWTMLDYYDRGEEVNQRYGGRLGPFAQKLYMPLFRTRYQLDGDRIPFDFDEIIASFAPRAFFSNSPLRDSNFDVEGVKAGIASGQEVYRFFDAEDKLQVRYPDAEHDWPVETREEAYQFVDRILQHTPKQRLVEQ